ncbi:hypothetical protein C8R44DRAFT_851102 [Mycena epipterygia]|nr:hypothetical protein C8R44DRAFT_851102 [Mycena epipterygia]
MSVLLRFFLPTKPTHRKLIPQSSQQASKPGPGRRSPPAIRLCQGDGDALRPRRVGHRSQLASFSRLHAELPAAAAAPVWAANAATSARTLQLEYHSEWHNNIDTNKSKTSNTAPPPPTQRKWFDAVVDLLVGAEDPMLAARDKFALICSKCFAHNGLVPEAMWADATSFRCSSFFFCPLPVPAVLCLSCLAVRPLPSAIPSSYLTPFSSPLHSILFTFPSPVSLPRPSYLRYVFLFLTYSPFLLLTLSMSVIRPPSHGVCL